MKIFFCHILPFYRIIIMKIVFYRQYAVKLIGKLKEYVEKAPMKEEGE